LFSNFLFLDFKISKELEIKLEKTRFKEFESPKIESSEEETLRIKSISNSSALGLKELTKSSKKIFREMG